MSDTRLHDGEPPSPVKLVPATWTFKELIPRQEVQAVMAQDERYAGQSHEQVASELASNYFIANLRALKHVSPEARNNYHLECEKLAHSIAALLADAQDQQDTELDKKAQALTQAIEGSLTEVSAAIVRSNANALAALQKLEDGKTARVDQSRVTQLVREAALDADKLD